VKIIAIEERARDANDEATGAVRAHPERLRALVTLPTSDPEAAAADLKRGGRTPLRKGRQAVRP
jgi:predicted TIM-barrel fold metal-dependent hydrolase